MIGQTLSHYRIEATLGEGGMGVVYRARDTRLDRIVAIKILHPGRVANPEGKRRFVQEAKAASALNHPNIVHIYDIDSASGVDFIAMEYVEGATLHDVIARKGLKQDQTLHYAVQIADALAAAHAAGIVHRDIKPSNIMVTGKGLVKILDFGLAKLMEQPAADPNAPTETVEPLTEQNTTVGTPAYMSPEQAEGKNVDARSDIFSFGSLLYEMVTGQRAFQGDNTISVLSNVLHKEPAPLSEAARTPVAPELQSVIGRCLRKDPQRRMQHLDDVKLLLEELKEASASGIHAQPSAAATPRLRSVLWAALGAVLLVAGFLAWSGRRAPQTPEFRAIPLATLPGVKRQPSFSPDGDRIAFTWDGLKQDNPDIYVQQIGSGSPLRLTTDSANDYGPAWSPDGRWIAFLRAQGGGKIELRLVPPLGGTERKLSETQSRVQLFRPLSLAWCPDSDCVIVTDSADGKTEALFVVSLESGEKRQLTHPQGRADVDPAVSPDGRWLLFERNISPLTGEVYLLPLGAGLAVTGEPRLLAKVDLSAINATWMPDSKEILFSAKGNLWRLPISGASMPSRLPFVGEDGLTPVVSRPQPGRPARLVYVHSYQDQNIWRIETSGPGVPASSPPVVAIASTKTEFSPQFSPNGRRVVFVSQRSGDFEIWSADADGSNAVQLTSMRAVPGYPQWSPDGESIVFHSNPEGRPDIIVVPAAGGKPRILTSQSDGGGFPTFSPDGQWVYYTTSRDGGFEISKIALSGGAPVLVTSHAGAAKVVSRDGYVYYVDSIDRPCPLWRAPVAGGDPVKVLEEVALTNFFVLDGGIYYMDQPSGESEPRLQYFDFATRASRTVARNLGKVTGGLTVSPDGRTMLFARIDSNVDDLMLVENFQ